MVGALRPDRGGHRHLRHDSGPAAPNQAAIQQQDPGATPSRFDRCIHAGATGTDHQHVGIHLPHRFIIPIQLPPCKA
jgi:hypothetical protein